jgi:hypothetical protein
MFDLSVHVLDLLRISHFPDVRHCRKLSDTLSDCRTVGPVGLSDNCRTLCRIILSDCRTGAHERDLELDIVHTLLEQQQLVLSAARPLPRREAEDGVILERTHIDAERVCGVRANGAQHPPACRPGAAGWRRARRASTP